MKLFKTMCIALTMVAFAGAATSGEKIKVIDISEAQGYKLKPGEQVIIVDSPAYREGKVIEAILQQGPVNWSEEYARPLEERDPYHQSRYGGSNNEVPDMMDSKSFTPDVSQLERQEMVERAISQLSPRFIIPEHNKSLRVYLTDRPAPTDNFWRVEVGCMNKRVALIVDVTNPERADFGCYSTYTPNQGSSVEELGTVITAKWASDPRRKEANYYLRYNQLYAVRK